MKFKIKILIIHTILVNLIKVLLGNKPYLENSENKIDDRTYKSLIELNSNEIKENFRFVFSIINTGDTSPSFIYNNQRDLLGESWYEAENELTSLGARKQFLLGHRNKLKYAEFLKNKYLYNEVFLTTLNSTCASQSLFSHLQGLFPSGTGPKLFPEQIDKAIPHTPIKDLDKLKADLQNDALPNNINSFRIFTYQDSERFIGLQNENKCEGVSEYVNGRVEKEEINSAYEEFKSNYEQKLADLNYLKSVDKKLNLTYAIQIAEAYISNIHDYRDLTMFHSNFDKEAFHTSAKKLLDAYHINGKYKEFKNYEKEYKKYIARIASSKLIRRIKGYISKRVGLDLGEIKKELGDFEYMPVFPKYVILSLDAESFSAVSQFFALSFSSKHKLSHVPASSIQVELFYDSEKKTPIKDDYTVRVLFNDDEIFKDNFSIFDSKTIEYELDDQEITDFCINYYLLSKRTKLLIGCIVTAVVAIILIIYAICLKMRKDNFIKLMSNSQALNE